jgi:hypothetical protein
MTRLRFALLIAPALALLTSIVFVWADTPRTTHGKYELLTGTVDSVADRQVTIRQPDGKDRTLIVDDGTTLRLDGRTARLSDFRKGTRVRVRYQPIDGKEHVVLMRTPLAAKVLVTAGRDFLNSLKDFSFDKKEEYERKLNENVSELDERIEDLQDRVQAVKGDARERAQADLKELQRQSEQLHEKMVRLKTVGADGWDSLKADIDRTTSDIHRTYDRVREAVK